MVGAFPGSSRDPFNARIAAVIPAFNEKLSIAAVVRQVSQRALVIVVDDGSTDDTGARAIAAGATVVRHDLNRGYDAALETGLQTAIELGCAFAVTMDADGQHDPSLVERFSNVLKDGADLVVGHRDRTQRWSEKLFCLLGRSVWRLNDPLCGMKGYRLSIFQNLKALNTYPSVGTEMALRLIEFGVRATQIKIETQKRDGISRFGGGFKANMRICKALWIGLVKCKYRK
jgi:glycosyltransferase involved in cell wall biosynthesis